MTGPVLLAVVLTCAVLVGMSISRTSTCAVTAAKELVFKRRATMVVGFMVAASAAGVVSLPLSWLPGSAFHLAAETPVSSGLVLGAVLIGLGAVINDACLLGTLARIGQGEMRFLALPLGLALGFALAGQQDAWVAAMPLENRHALPSPAGGLIVLMFAAALAWAWWHLGRERKKRDVARKSLRGGFLVMGLCGALLFTLEPHWTYSDAVHAIVRRGNMDARIDVHALATALALLAGAVVSGIRSKAFVARRPSAPGIARSLAGGAVMAFGGTLIPGGNDSLLLAAIPSATVGGLTAYAIMSVTVHAALWLLRARRPQAPHPAA